MASLCNFTAGYTKPGLVAQFPEAAGYVVHTHQSIDPVNTCSGAIDPTLKRRAHTGDSADDEARWVEKGKDASLHYRAVDTEDDNVGHVEVHPTNQAKVNKLPGIIDVLFNQVVWPDGVLADKAEATAANREHLNGKEISDLIQFKGSDPLRCRALRTDPPRGAEIKKACLG